MNITTSLEPGTVYPAIHADGVLLRDAWMTAGSPTLHTAHAFAASDVGKMILVAGAGTPLGPAGGTVTGNTSGTGNQVPSITTVAFQVGCGIIGAGIPAGTTVIASAGGGTQTATLSQNLNGSGATGTSLFIPTALCTTIQSVAGGVATLAANAATSTTKGASTTTSAQVYGGQDFIPVASVSGFQIGGTVTIDTGANQETCTIIGLNDSAAAPNSIAIEPATTLAHNSGVTVSATGTVCLFASDDTALVNSAISAANSQPQGGKVYLQNGIIGINGTLLTMKSNVVLQGAGRYATWLAMLGYPNALQPGVVMVPPGCQRWEVRDLEISGIHWSGGQWPAGGTNDAPHSALIAQGGSQHGRVARCRMHNASNSVLAIEAQTGSLGNAAGCLYDIQIEDCEVWNSGEDGFELNSSGTPSHSRIVILNVETHHNALEGMEIDGSSAGWAVDIFMDGFRAHHNQYPCGLQLGGVSPATVAKSILNNIQCWQNGTAGVNLARAQNLLVTNLVCHDNGFANQGPGGVQIQMSSNITIVGVHSFSNVGPGVEFDTVDGFIEIDGFHCHDNGQAGVNVSNAGGASNDVVLRGTASNNSMQGVVCVGLVRGKLDIYADNNGGVGVELNGGTHVMADVAANNNNGTGVQIHGTSTKNTLLIAACNDGSGHAQTTPWSTDASSTGCIVFQGVIDGTASNSGGATVK